MTVKQPPDLSFHDSAVVEPEVRLGFWSYVGTPSSSRRPARARIRQGGQRTLASGGPAADLRRRLGGSAQRRGVGVGRQDAAEVAARGDVELGEDLAQVILDGTPGQEQP